MNGLAWPPMAKAVHLNIPDEILTAIDAEADRLGQTRTTFVLRAVTAALPPRVEARDESGELVAVGTMAEAPFTLPPPLADPAGPPQVSPRFKRRT